MHCQWRTIRVPRSSSLSRPLPRSRVRSELRKEVVRLDAERAGVEAQNRTQVDIITLSKFDHRATYSCTIDITSCGQSMLYNRLRYRLALRHGKYAVSGKIQSKSIIGENFEPPGGGFQYRKVRETLNATSADFMFRENTTDFIEILYQILSKVHSQSHQS